MKTLVIFAIALLCDCIPTYDIEQNLLVDCNERYFITEVWQRKPTRLLLFNYVKEETGKKGCLTSSSDWMSSWTTPVLNDSVKRAQYKLAELFIVKTKQAQQRTKQP